MPRGAALLPWMQKQQERSCNTHLHRQIGIYLGFCVHAKSLIGCVRNSLHVAGYAPSVCVTHSTGKH